MPKCQGSLLLQGLATFCVCLGPSVMYSGIQKRVDELAQLVKCLPIKHEALGWILSTASRQGHMLVIPALGMWKDEDQKFRKILGSTGV